MEIVDSRDEIIRLGGCNNLKFWNIKFVNFQKEIPIWYLGMLCEDSRSSIGHLNLC